MSYQVLARKYRPQRFSEVVGQDHVTQTLSNAIRQKRIAHAYLFVGPRGTGKTTLARILAKCLNCTGGPNTDFADDDPRCREIAEGRALDVLEIDGASNRGIDEIRELRETVKYAPAVSRFKIYIIDEVHMLTKEAFNALLKTLEEPPDHVKFMFATTEPEKVLPTILSRCQRFDLRRIPTALIVRHLAQIAKLEGVEAEPLALEAIARGAEGGMRDAESALDQLISFCGERVREEDVLSMFGLTARGEILELAQAAIAGEAEKALRHLQDLAQGGKDLGRLLSDLLLHFRNLLLYKVCRGDLSLLDVSEAEAQAIGQQSASVSAEVLSKMMEVLSECEASLRDAASKRIAMEVALIRLMEARQQISLDAVIQKLLDWRQEGPNPESPARSAPPVQPGSAPAAAARPAETAPRKLKTEAPAALSPAPAPVGEARDLAGLWIQVMEAVGRASPFARTYLLQAHPVAFAKNVLTIGFDPEFSDQIGLVDNAKNRTLIQTKLQELGFSDSQIKFVVAEAPPQADSGAEVLEAAQSAPAAASAPEPPRESKPESKSAGADDFKNDPLIKQALELFKGTIVEVRS